MNVRSILIKEFMEGKVLLFDKPLYWTSFDLVKKVKSILASQLELKKIKIGHAGTLDPLARGLIIICTGKETKNIELYQAGTKEYFATLFLGATTPSFDLETPVDRYYGTRHITRQLTEQVLLGFIGKQLQDPPMHSARNVNGVRAYRYARKGTQILLSSHEIEIHSLRLESFDLPSITISVTCSKGTYIRSLARDIGIRLNTGAYLTSLVRTCIGNYYLKDAIRIEDFERNLIGL